MRKFFINHAEFLFRSEDIEELEKSILAKWDKQDSFCMKVVEEWYFLKGLIVNEDLKQKGEIHDNKNKE